jgi:hypothetical protein
MTLHKPKFPPLRRPARKPRGAAPPEVSPVVEGPPKAAREPHDEDASSEPAETGWRASSYDLKQGLDVVELATSLPPDVLDRLFNAPKR